MEEACKPVLNTGLRGVTIASTKISDVNGTEGKLIYRGYLVKDLAENVTFEEVIYLLIYERLPSGTEYEDFKKNLGQQRGIPADLIAALKTRPKDALPMDVL